MVSPIQVSHTKNCVFMWKSSIWHFATKHWMMKIKSNCQIWNKRRLEFINLLVVNWNIWCVVLKYYFCFKVFWCYVWVVFFYFSINFSPTSVKSRIIWWVPYQIEFDWFEKNKMGWILLWKLRTWLEVWKSLKLISSYSVLFQIFSLIF